MGQPIAIANEPAKLVRIIATVATTRRSVTRTFAIALTLLVGIGTILVWAIVLHTLTTPGERPPMTGRPQAIVWGARVFTTENAFKVFLERQGFSYVAWARRHPSGVRLLRHEAPGKVGRKTAQRARVSAAARPEVRSTGSSSTVRAAASPLAGDSHASGSIALALILALLGTGLAVSAVLPERLAPAAVRRLYRLPEHRLVGLAAALSIYIAMILERP